MICKDKGYKVGQVFEVVGNDEEAFKVGSIIVLSEDIGNTNPLFDLVWGECRYEYGILTERGAHELLKNVKRIYPPEEGSKPVEITCEGKTVEISRESAKALNLI